jgi:hypothetical protein
MKPERIDAETLAAFLDGTLPEAERRRVVEQLAADPEEYEVFADAHRAALAVGDWNRPTAPRHRGTHIPWRLVLPLAAAAGVALAAYIALRPGSPAPLVLAQAVSSGFPRPARLSDRLGPDWDQTGWSVVRGSTSQLPSSALEFRLGVRAMDVEIASAAGDSVAAALAGAEVLDLLSGEPGSGAVAGLYRRLLSLPAPAPREEREVALVSLLDLIGEPLWLELGATIEAARIAALARDWARLARGGIIHRSVRSLSGDALTSIPSLTDALILLDDGIDDLKRTRFLAALRTIAVQAGQ